MSIENVIKEVDALFKEHNYDKVRFTVDYDEMEGGLYCYYTPFINDKGFDISDYLLYVEDTPVADLVTLQNHLSSKGIHSRFGYEWDPSWGKSE